MEKLISDILEIERTAQNITAKAKKQRADFDKEIKEETEKMKSELDLRRAKRLENVRATELESAEEKLAELEEKFSRRRAELERIYLQNREQYVGKIVGSVIGD